MKLATQIEEKDRGLEPKIDFDNLKNQPVSSYLTETKGEKIINQQDEIIFEDDKSYKAPDIGFLSKPELSERNLVDQNELDINAEKLKKCISRF